MSNPDKQIQEAKVAILKRVGEPRAFEIDYAKTPKERKCVIKTIEWYKKTIESLIIDIKEESTVEGCNPECKLCNPA